MFHAFFCCWKNASMGRFLIINFYGHLDLKPGFFWRVESGSGHLNPDPQLRHHRYVCLCSVSQLSGGSNLYFWCHNKIKTLEMEIIWFQDNSFFSREKKKKKSFQRILYKQKRCVSYLQTSSLQFIAFVIRN